VKRLLPVPSTPDFEERLLAEISQENLRAELRAALQPTYSGPKEQAVPPREIWPGKDYELARKVRDELGAAATEPGKFTDALKRACERYQREDGSLYKPKNLRQGLVQWEDWHKGKHARQY